MKLLWQLAKATCMVLVNYYTYVGACTLAFTLMGFANQLINLKMPFEKRIVSYIPHSIHGAEDRCSLSLYCKFEIIMNCLLLVMQLFVTKIVTLIKIENLR